MDKVKQTEGFCPGCNYFVGIHKLTLDHIYPVSKAYEDFLKSGTKRIYTINDVQPLCIRCNSSKSNKIQDTGILQLNPKYNLEVN